MKEKIEKIIYPGKSLIRTEKIILTDEGLPNETVEVEITKEKPKDMGFGNAVIEAMKLAKFIPAKESGDKTVNVRMSLQFYFYNRKENRIEIK